MTILQYVEINSNLVYIDTRVYCRDVINVDHGDWFQSVLLKYKKLIERKFGLILLETGKITGRGRPEKYALLTESQFKFLLSKSRKHISEELIKIFKIEGWDISSYAGISRKCHRAKESDYRNNLAQKLDGKKDVKTLAGNIDILTNSQIIEVKEIKSWKHALGQVLVYSDYYPSHEKRIHLYGETQQSFLEMINKHCVKRKVIVTWEP